MPFSVLPIGYTLPTAPPVAGTMPLPWRDGRRTMAYFGDIDGRSGLVELFEMCTRAGERLADWRLVLVGRPVEHWLDHFRRLAEAPEFSLAVDFVVYPEPDHQAAVLAEAQLVVQPHLTPTPGVAALWALAQDKPVLLTAATPAARALETSQLVAPATPEGVRDRLVELIDLPPDDLRGLGVQAGAAIRAACAWSACIPAYAALYTSVGQRPAPSK